MPQLPLFLRAMRKRKNFAVIMAEYEGNSFSILPLAKKDKLPQVIDYIIKLKIIMMTSVRV